MEKNLYAENLLAFVALCICPRFPSLPIVVRGTEAAARHSPPYNGEIKPLGIGPNNGKGGSLEKAAWAYHSTKLPEGKWNISLYAKRQDGSNSNIQMDMEALDEYGLRLSPPWKLTLNEIG